MIRVVFMGSADLSATMLERLSREPGVQVVGCVTQPDKPAGRSKKLTPCACKAFVDAVGIPCLTPERVNTPESLAQIAAWLPDVIVVVAYGQFLSRRLLDIPTLGCINIHLSLLPKYRGASPIHAALLNGDAVTGATAMLMDEGMDSGPILDGLLQASRQAAGPRPGHHGLQNPEVRWSSPLGRPHRAVPPQASRLHSLAFLLHLYARGNPRGRAYAQSPRRHRATHHR